ncbi:MAG TPA: monofunctional biosynthetic peptidoglycan transglycosylase [Bacteroidia bacterium]|nr:monofunctional biosynthetic peptidoglycan transglycosylase [Bacteroidia bacterium]
MVKRVLKIILKIVVGFLILSIATTIIYRFVPVPVTPLMLIRCVEQKQDGKSMKLSKNWKPLEEISSHLQLAVVCTEDQNFLLHYGFDFEALKKAMLNNEKSKKIRGGSTISQQTAKNVFLWNGRNYVRKGFEAYFTLLIETAWSKERIMEVYLNVIEFGDGIYGAEAASQHYFKKSATKINREEAAILACLLPNPRVYGKNIGGSYVQSRKQWTLQQMRFWGGKLDFDKED